MKKIYTPIFIKIIIVLLTFLIMAGIFSFRSNAIDYPDVSNAEAVYVYNVENDSVLFAYNEKEKVFPTSTAKIMTAIIAIEHYGGNFDDKLTVSSDAIKGVTGNYIALKAGEVVTVRDLLGALIVGGANDAANVIAFDISGNQADFVRKMNEKAREIGALNTVYTNPYGIHNNSMYTTAEDTAKIALYAYKINYFTETSSLAKYEISATNMSETRVIHNRNYLISRNRETKYYLAGVSGLNAGGTEQGGNCLAAAKSDKGLTQLCIVMGAKEIEGTVYSYVYAKELFEWAFASFGYVKLLDKNKMICELPVTLSNTADHVTLLPERNVEKYLPIDIDIDSEIDLSYTLYSESLEAPVEGGLTAGFLTLSYNGEVIDKLQLVTNNSVDRTQFLYILSKIENLTKSAAFIFSAITFVFLSVIYLLAVSYIRGQNQRKQNRKR